MDATHPETLLGAKAPCWVDTRTRLWPRQVYSIHGRMHSQADEVQAFAGHELLMLAESFPDGRHIIGIDLAEGMVDLANARCAEAGIRLAAPRSHGPSRLAASATWLMSVPPFTVTELELWSAMLATWRHSSRVLLESSPCSAYNSCLTPT